MCLQSLSQTIYLIPSCRFRGAWCSVDERLPRSIIQQFCLYEKGFLQKKRMFLCPLLKWSIFSRIAQHRTNQTRATCMQKRSTPSRNGSRGDFVPFPVPCRVQGQRPCWGLGQSPNQTASVDNANVPTHALMSAEQRSGRSSRNVFSAAQATKNGSYSDGVTAVNPKCA